MKPINEPIYFIVCFLLIAIACNRVSEKVIPRYDFANHAYLHLEYKNVSDSIYVRSWHWNVIPMEEIESDSFLLFGNGNIVLEVNVNKTQRVNFYFNDQRLDFFFMPNDTTTVEFDFAGNLDSVIPVFSGKFEIVNNYYFEKFKRFNSWDFFIPRVGFTQSSLNAIDLAKHNDDLTKLELDFLDDFNKNNKLQPDWFFDYEKQNIIITSGYFKRNSIFYRSYMLGIKDSIPENYYDFADSIDVNSGISVLTDYYFSYVSDLLSLQFRSEQENGFDTLRSLSRNKKYYDYLFNYTWELEQPARELFSLYNLFNYGRRKPEYLEMIDTLKENIVTPEYLVFYNNSDFSSYQLPEEKEAPGFYLADIDGKFWKLSDFRGKVVLLNFWSTNCIPCINEFPYEDTLVKEFESYDFQLINICMTSSLDNWKWKIKGHERDILQLYAKDKWNDILKDNYKVYGYPKFVLIDENGAVVNADAPKPSNPELKREIQQLISEN